MNVKDAIEPAEAWECWRHLRSVAVLRTVSRGEMRSSVETRCNDSQSGWNLTHSSLNLAGQSWSYCFGRLIASLSAAVNFVAGAG